MASVAYLKTDCDHCNGPIEFPTQLGGQSVEPLVVRRFLSPDQPDSVSLITDPNSKRNIKFGIKTYLARPRNNNEKLREPRLTPAQSLALAERIAVRGSVAGSPLTKENSPELAPKVAQDDDPADEELDDIAEDIVRNFSKSTNLIFVNAKRTIEILAVKLRERVRLEKLPHDPFVVHHGSISKELREEAEAELKDAAPTTAICSSTLEMGIDIGAVRCVGQVDTPWSVASMVQRLGRSGRRDGESAINRHEILSGAYRTQWFPWIGTRGMETLRAFARRANIPHEVDSLSIIYEAETQTVLAHLREIGASSVSSTELAGFMPVKAIEKFDEYLPEHLLDIANGNDRLDLEVARYAARQALLNYNGVPSQGYPR